MNTEELNYDPEQMLKARALYDYQAGKLSLWLKIAEFLTFNHF